MGNVQASCDVDCGTLGALGLRLLIKMKIVARNLLLDAGKYGDEQRWQLVASLFRQPRFLAVSSTGSLIAAGVCWRQTGSSWYLVWGFAGCIMLGLRLALALTFHRNRSRFEADSWAWMFLAGAISTALIAGVGAGLTVLFTKDLVAGLYMATNVLSFAGGAAVRNSASPLAARSQTTIALGLPGMACLMSGTPYLQFFAVLILLHLTAQYEIIRSLGRMTGWLISTERRQAALNEQLSKTCDQLAK